MTGDAFTFVAPEEESDLRAIERAIGKRLPRVTVPGFDYRAAPAERLEVPLAERIAAIRARKAQERTRAKEKAVRRITHAASAASHPPPSRPHASRPQASRPHDSRPQALRPQGGARPKTEERPRWGRRG
jgi:ATP-dependent RNA helicase RhlE